MKAIVIGAGFGGLSSAALLAKRGWDVTLVEKNEELGGRGRPWSVDGYNFDMGPSWYLMPEVFDTFFEKLGKKREDYYGLKELETYYKVYFEKHEPVTVTKDLSETISLFDSFEPMGGKRLLRYLEQAKYKYDTAMKEFLYVEYKNIFQFFNRKVLSEGLKLNIFESMDTFVSRYFKDIRARQILQYAMVFLGTAPADAPALYSIMSHVDMNLGVWYPENGMSGAVAGFEKVARDLGVKIVSGQPVERILSKDKKAIGVATAEENYYADIVVSSADYHHSETALLEEPQRQYSERYWEKRTVAPSMFLIYLGMEKKIPSMEHHNLYFADDWGHHFDTIFKYPSWPKNPCFYLSCNSKTDPNSAPTDGENVFILVPTAAGLKDDDSVIEEYGDVVLDHVAKVTGEDFRSGVKVKRIYSTRDFEHDYNAYKGTALGLSHTLFQTAVFRPSHRSKKVGNLYYTGQYTHPGVGIPMAIISSEIISKEIEKDFP